MCSYRLLWSGLCCLFGTTFLLLCTWIHFFQAVWTLIVFLKSLIYVKIFFFFGLVVNWQTSINNWKIYWHFQQKGQGLVQQYKHIACTIERCNINTRGYYNWKWCLQKRKHKRWIFFLMRAACVGQKFISQDCISDSSYLLITSDISKDLIITAVFRDRLTEVIGFCKDEDDSCVLRFAFRNA